MLVAGDIGGTKTDLAIFSSEAGPLAPLAQERVHSRLRQPLTMMPALSAPGPESRYSFTPHSKRHPHKPTH